MDLDAFRFKFCCITAYKMALLPQVVVEKDRNSDSPFAQKLPSLYYIPSAWTDWVMTTL